MIRQITIMITLAATLAGGSAAFAQDQATGGNDAQQAGHSEAATAPLSV